MMKSQILLLVLILFTLFACKTQPEQKNEAKTEEPVAVVISEVLNPADFQTKANEIADVQLIDVRTPEEVAQGKIPGAVNINILDQSFSSLVSELDKLKPIMVYCAKGGRSGRAANELKKLGFTEIYDLEGGMGAWSAAGLSIE